MLAKSPRVTRNLFIFFVICALAISLIYYTSHILFKAMPGTGPVAFPVMTIFLFVFHMMIAAFMIMKYICEKRRLYLMPIACAFAGSALLLAGTLSTYPEWYMCTSGRLVNYNNAIIYYFFRNIMMAALFTTAAVLYYYRKSTMHVRKIHASILIAIGAFTASMIILAWLYASGHELFHLSFIDNLTLTFTPLWRYIIGWALVSLWFLTLYVLLRITRLKNIFWFSGGFFCACYIVTLIILLTADHSAGYSWYQARFFETLCTLFLFFVLLCDVFHLYRTSHDKYLDSYQNSIRDSLTRLYNRSFFYDTLTSQLRATTPATPISVIVSDLDRFKRINDQYGHLQGDKVIQYVARVLQNAARVEDVAARIGGEEFALLLMNVSSEEAQRIAERIRVTIEKQDAQSSNDHLPEPVTISMGVFTTTSSALSAEECVQRADQAMYRAKETGRNRVVVWG
ncbi:GGDEF domain-containing protein [Yokenella regensburgei]|jgi:diguanylate cyclase (GGDEF)-like protein|uniref:sensor domain-containing diguanylate cyclase n=1 Tax=Yokenella regensburgei TaxID=158877 RepID=UPI0027D9C0E9|nr:MASE4 domain-containing protein [Yokenella regensburgei]MDQ4428035.1 GGDEF domain-containing protein [Yokenella regensburgei]